MFENIRNHAIPWSSLPPGSLSPEAIDLISKLLDPDPKKRLGSKGSQEIKSHNFFKEFEWEKVRKMEAAFVPEIRGGEDVSNFEKEGRVEEWERENPFVGEESNKKNV